MFCATKLRVEPRDAVAPSISPAENDKPVQAIITPKVRGMRDSHVVKEYLTAKEIEYASTVKSGDNACRD